MDNSGFSIGPRRILSAPQHRWLAEDNDAGYEEWVRAAIGGDGHGRRENNNSSSNRVGAWSRRHGSLRNLYGAEEVQLRWETGGEKNEAKKWVPISESMDLVGTHHLPTMSARSQAIADHQKEMMKLVRDMPDWNYELTLQDIVERSGAAEGVEKDAPEENAKSGNGNMGEKKKKKGQQCVGRKQRPEGGGLFLSKMFLPVALNGKRGTSQGRGGSKVLPRQPSIDGRTMYEDAGRSVDRGKSNDRSRGAFGCWSFCSYKKRK